MNPCAIANANVTATATAAPVPSAITAATAAYFSAAVTTAPMFQCFRRHHSFRQGPITDETC